jgi:predicted DNA-binding transcriptional regulator AlpA
MNDPDDPKFEDRILSVAEVCRIVGKHRATLYRWAEDGLFPRFRRFGRRSAGLWWSELLRWMRSHQSPT